MIQRRVSVFYKLTVFWTGIRFSENVNVRALKCEYDGKHQKLGENDDSETRKKFLQIAHLLVPNGV